MLVSSAYWGVRFTKEVILIPSRKQWNSWSLPSKYTAIGTLVAVLSLSPQLYQFAYSFYGKGIGVDKNQSTNISSLSTTPNNDVTFKVKNMDEVLNEYKGDGNIKYRHLNFNNFPSLKSKLETVNKSREEYPKRAIDISILQQKVDSGDIGMAEYAVNEIIKKQNNIKLLRK